MLDGALQILGQNALLPCNVIVELLVFAVKVICAFSEMMDYLNTIGITMFKNIAFPATIALQKLINSVVGFVPELLGNVANNRCFSNMAYQLKETLSNEPNITVYVAEYTKVFEFQEGIREIRESGLSFLETYGQCTNRCACLQKLIKILVAFSGRLGPIMARNWVLGSLVAISQASRHFVTDLNKYVNKISIGVRKMALEYKECIASKF